MPPRSVSSSSVPASVPASRIRPNAHMNAAGTTRIRRMIRTAIAIAGSEMVCSGNILGFSSSTVKNARGRPGGKRLYAAVDTESKLLLDIDIYSCRGTDPAAAFLHRLTEKHDIQRHRVSR